MRKATRNYNSLVNKSNQIKVNMRKYLSRGLAVMAVLAFGTSVANAQNVTYAMNTVSISIADVIGIVDDNNNQIEAFTEATAFNMGAVNFSYPDAASYQTTQTAPGGHFNISASTPFKVEVKAATANFTSDEAGALIPVGVLNITGTAPAGVTITEIPAGGLTTAYKPFATGGTGAVMRIAPSYTVPAAQAQANIFGKPDGTYTVDVIYQVSAQ